MFVINAVVHTSSPRYVNIYFFMLLLSLIANREADIDELGTGSLHGRQRRCELGAESIGRAEIGFI